MNTRLLIADDEPIIRMDLRGALESQGYEVVADVPDGVQALQMARDLKPDLVILDIKMPGMGRYRGGAPARQRGDRPGRAPYRIQPRTT